MGKNQERPMDRLLQEFEQDRRYSGDVPDAVRFLLKDQGARLKGHPQWERDEDPELYDAILVIRESIVRTNKEIDPDESPFNIGSSYQRWINSWLSSKSGYKLFLKMYSTIPEMVAAPDLVDKRVASIITNYPRT